MPLAPAEETIVDPSDTSATDPPQIVSLSDATSETTEESSTASSAENREAGVPLPTEIMAILSVLLGDSISELTTEQLEDIVADFGERLSQLLSVAAVIMQVPLADQNPIYQDLISQFNNES